jgi:hypothetical protein
VWRKSLGSTVPPFSGADGDGSGIIDQADLAVWRANFGRTLPAAAGAATDAIASMSVREDMTPSTSQARRAGRVTPRAEFSVRQDAPLSTMFDAIDRAFELV